MPPSLPEAQKQASCGVTGPEAPLRPSRLPTQVKIFEEDFRKERSDRERMNEEKEELRRQLEQLQAQVVAQVRVNIWETPPGSSP